MRSVGLLLVIVVCLLSARAHAQLRNSYGAKGRTVMSAGFSGMVHGSGYTQSHEAWGIQTRATLVHFVRNNFAIGGTFATGLQRLRDNGYGDDQEASFIGGDVDIIGHVPLTRSLSLRFWGWLGVRQRSRDVGLADPYSAQTLTASQKLRYFTLGFGPELLLHCSSSVALGMGPRLVAWAPLSDGAVWDGSINFGSSISYSFGAPPASEASPKPVVPRFAGRGRNVLMGGVSLGTDTGVSLGYARFLTDHFALGPLFYGGTEDGDVRSAVPYWVGVGVQSIAELPLRGRWSMLFWTSLAYRYDRFDSVETDISASYRPTYTRDTIRAHELQLSGSIYPVFHLFEALVIGVGPTITEHVRMASSVDGLDRAYLSLGVTSVLAGSF